MGQSPGSIFKSKITDLLKDSKQPPKIEYFVIIMAWICNQRCYWKNKVKVSWTNL